MTVVASCNPELRLWHIGPNVVRLIQLKQGQTPPLSGTLAAKVSISAAVFIILRLSTIVLLSTYKTLPSKA
jgi:hypothetical protein